MPRLRKYYPQRMWRAWQLKAAANGSAEPLGPPGADGTKNRLQKDGSAASFAPIVNRK